MCKQFLYLLISVAFGGSLICSSADGQSLRNTENFTVKEGLSKNVVHCILQDSKGFLWIGTHEGLNRYDGYAFRKYLHNKDDSSSLPNSQVEGLYEYDQDHILVMTASGPVMLNRPTEKFSTVESTLMDRTNSIREFLPKNFTTHSAIDPYYGNNGTVPDFQKIIQTYPAALSFYYDGSGRFWVLKNNQLLVVEKDGSERIVYSGFNIPHKTKFSGLINDLNGNLWIRVPAKLYCIDQKTMQLKATVDQAQLNDLSIDNILTLLLDRSGVLWVGSFYGLRKLNISQQNFRHFVQQENGQGLGSNFVLGLNLAQGNSLTVQHFFNEPFYTEIRLPDLKTRRLPMEGGNVKKILEEVLIRHIDRASREMKNKQFEKLENSKFDWKNFRYGYTDSQGIIWSINVAGRVINFHDDRVILLELGAQFLADDDQFIWVATTNQGLFRYHKIKGDIKKYLAAKNNPFAITRNELLCLVQDANENLWIGTRGGGLNYFDKETETFTAYTQQNGLSNNTIYCMVMDNDENLWMGTAHGLSYFNTRSKTFQNFYTSDGLINTEFNRWSAVKDDAGVLYFGGMHGIDYFKPADVLRQKNTALNIQFSDFKIGNQSLQLQNGIVLTHKENHISIEFTAMDFRNPDATQYQYMLEGASDEWINNGNDNTATFAALPPGEYIFRVKAAAQNGIWSQEATLPFTIQTPWWKTNWFYGLCVLFIAALLYLAYKFRINQLRKLYTVRSKISQDLHDEVGATLSSIHVYSSVASKAMNADVSKARDALEQINVNARQVMENMNDIVWAMHTADKGGITFENKLKNYGYELLTPLNIDCSYNISREAEKQLRGIEARRNILLITKEAINNIAKHSEATKASIQLKTEGKHVLLEIIDNGKGVNSKRNGHGLRNMESRAKVLGGKFQVMSENGNGTHLRFSIPITNIRD